MSALRAKSDVTACGSPPALMKMLPKFQKQTTNANQYTLYDFQDMAKEWDDMVDQERSHHRDESRHPVF
jgi:hypothetical protein